LLTGGRSRPLGVDKAAVTVGGRTLADRGAALLSAVCEPVLEVGPGRSHLPVAREDLPGAGPLAALAAGGTALTERGHRGAAVLLAVDLPRMVEPFLRFLRDWPGAPTVVPSVEGRQQPVCARYGADALVAAGSLVAGGVTSLRDLLDVVEHDVLGEGEWSHVAGVDVLGDLDTPADAQRLGVDLGAAAPR
jgi:molybdopterin-guanine dinucleotide biosynthesis protein A